MTREQKIAMVIEALRFGFSMGSRKADPRKQRRPEIIRPP